MQYYLPKTDKLTLKRTIFLQFETYEEDEKVKVKNN